MGFIPTTSSTRPEGNARSGGYAPRKPLGNVTVSPVTAPQGGGVPLSGPTPPPAWATKPHGQIAGISFDEAGRKVDQFGRWLFGDKHQPGVFGTGQMGVDRYDPNAQAGVIPNADATRTNLQQGATDAAARGPVQIDPTQQAQFRAGQSALVDALMRQATGQGPSVAQSQLQQATDRNMKQAMAMAASTQQPGALRQLAYQRGDIAQQGAAQSAELAMAEQLAARNQLGQVLAGARGQDIGLATGNAQLQQGQQKLNDDMVKFYVAAGMSLDQAQQQAAMELERLRMQGQLGFEALDLQAYQGAGAARSGWLEKLIPSIGNTASAVSQMLGGGAAAPPTYAPIIPATPMG